MGRIYPDKFISVYEMVSFSHIPYNTALSCIRAQDELLSKIMAEGDFAENKEKNGFDDKLNSWMDSYYSEVQLLDFGK